MVERCALNGEEILRRERAQKSAKGCETVQMELDAVAALQFAAPVLVIAGVTVGDILEIEAGEAFALEPGDDGIVIGPVIEQGIHTVHHATNTHLKSSDFKIGCKL